MKVGNLHGIVNMTNEEYHATIGLSKSKLDALSISPLNYWDEHINPDREPREYKHCFAVGDGTHKLVLEPGTFEKTYAVGFDKSQYPEALNTIDQLKQALNDRGIAARGSKPELVRILRQDGYTGLIMSELEEQHKLKMANLIPIPANDYKNMMAMLSAINRHHTAGKLLKEAAVEESYFVTDENGILRKCRTDAISACGNVIIDLKTTDDVSDWGFGRTISQRRYHVQAAWYLDILKMLYGDDAPSTFAFIAAQKTRPYDVAVHVITEDQIQLGRLYYQKDLQTFIECERTGIWYGKDKGQILQPQLPRNEMAKLIYGLQ